MTILDIPMEYWFGKSPSVTIQYMKDNGFSSLDIKRCQKQWAPLTRKHRKFIKSMKRMEK